MRNFTLLLIVLLWAAFSATVFSQPNQVTIKPVKRTDVPHRTNTAKAVAIPLRQPIFAKPNPEKKSADWQISFQHTPLKQHRIPGTSTAFDSLQAERMEAKRLQDSNVIVQGNDIQSAADFGALPILGNNFTGNKFNGWVPPDNSMAISDDGHIVSVVNSSVMFTDVSGNVHLEQNFDDFLDFLGLSSTYFDPKVLFDPVENKFIMVVLNGNSPGNSTVVIGYSVSENPSDGWWWKLYSGAPTGANAWFDYPSIGVSGADFYITGNLFDTNDNFVETIIYQFQKASGFVGGNTPGLYWYNITDANGNPDFGLMPVSYGFEGSIGPGIYFLSSQSGGGSSQIMMYYTTNSIGNNPDLEVFAVNDGDIYTAPINGFQLGTSNELRTNDCRMLSGFYGSDILHFVMHTSINGYTCINYGRLDPSNLVLEDRAFGLNGFEYAFPSIAPFTLDPNNKSALIGFLRTGSSIYPQFRVVSFDNDWNSNGSVPVKAGDSYVDLLGVTERWGDYSGICRRHNTSNIEVWVSGCYGNDFDNGTLNILSTWIAQISDQVASQPPVANFSANQTTITAGQSVTFTDLSINNPTSRNWVLPGGSPITSTLTNPIVTYNIPGTYSVTLTATNSAGSDSETKTNYIIVNAPGGSGSQCFAKISPTETREFMCHNLGAANTAADPFTPSWEINGGYWQWGRVAQAAAGPSGPGSSQANAGAIAGWSLTAAPNGSWSDNFKTSNDPCPIGFRVPTEAQWDGVIANETETNVGTWSMSSTNYSSGKRFGSNLLLPASGGRFGLNGALDNRGNYGYYRSSTEGFGADDAWHLFFSSSDAIMESSYGFSLNYRSFGLSVRCISESSLTGSIGSINCTSATINGTLTANQAASGVSASVLYTDGNGGAHSGQSVTSTGVFGLTATLAAGTFANGSGSLLYNITGFPGSSGTASFALNIGGKFCTLSITVNGNSGSQCSAKISATETREFMCHNLGSANTAADPFTPSWEINGGYWQWGRETQAAAGPTGPGAGQANNGAISGWNTTPASNGAWSDASKTANDPCPAGFRVPTKAQWEGVIANNTATDVGTWSSSTTNYGSGKKFGNSLLLPSAGDRDSEGKLISRGDYGVYWSSTEDVFYMYDAWYLLSGSSNFVFMNSFPSTSGFSVRCISESSVTGSIGSINCTSATISGTLTANQAVSGVSASVPYTGGNGGAHSGQSVTSTGVSGLTATLAAGTFANGSGSLFYNITGIPGSSGTASFALNIGGKFCTLSITVNGSSGSQCFAKISPTETREFMCHNLGSANTAADPFTPSWEINGGYWQWGREPQAAAGPSGPGSSQANAGVISGWNTTNASNGAWTENSKTANDPCPTGFRVPTKSQWDGVIAYNTWTPVGTWINNSSNYSSGLKFGNNLFLPGAGRRVFFNGDLGGRGETCFYWSSTEGPAGRAWYLHYSSGGYFGTTDNSERTDGQSVRCISESSLTGSIGSINCTSATINGTLTANQAASGVSASVPYTGGNGGAHSGQSVTSTGVFGLTATLAAGTFANGSGSLFYNITGIPGSSGTASFALNIGGKTCTLEIPVQSISQPPVANFSANQTTITAEQTIQFTDLSTNAPTSWNWSFPGGTPNVSTQSNPPVTYNTAGVYNVTLVASNSAGNDLETKMGYIVVNPAPQAPIADFIANETMIPIGGAVNFTDLSMNAPTSWNWSFPGSLSNTSSLQNPIIIYHQVGVYNVTLVSSNAVGSDVETKNGYINVGTIGTDELEQEGKISISPNPVIRGKNLEIELLLNQPEELEIFVVSGNGSVIKRLVDNRFKNGQTRLSFSTENLSAGYYFLIFQNPDKSFVQYEKFIVLD